MCRIPLIDICKPKTNSFLLILFHRDTDEPLLSYNHGSRFLTVPFEPQKICMMPTSGRIYHPGPSRLGNIGLISDKLGILWTSEQRFIFENGEENPPTQFKWDNATLNLTNELIGFLPRYILYILKIIL